MGRIQKQLARPWLRGVLGAGLVGLCGLFATLQVWILAGIAGLASFDLGRREAAEIEVGRDRTGWGMQLGFLAILAAAAFQNRDAAVAAQIPGLLELGGIAIILAGVALRQRVSRAMGEHFKVKIQVGQEHPLIQQGPFRRLRHPSYASLLLIAIGTAVSLRSPLAFGVALFIWLPLTLVRITHEERALQAGFGDAWRDYAARTWRLVPGIY
ncbi:MAG: isoprenylcysteine carboxylmethyltransferase family protein [bacterium]